MVSFSARVSEMVAGRKKLLEAVFKESVQEVAALMVVPGPSVANPAGGRGGHMPIDSGFLAASLTATIGAPPPAREKPPGDAKYSFDPGPVNLVIAGAEIEDTITLAFTANYARYVNHRYRFRDLAAQRWPQIIEANVKKAEAMLR